MKQQLEQRLEELRTEFESGQKMLAELEARQANLRISGRDFRCWKRSRRDWGASSTPHSEAG